MIQTTNLSYHDDLESLEDRCDSEYVMHEGVELFPVMGARDTPPVRVRVHAAYTERKSSFRYTRTRVPPLIPSPGDTLLGDKFLGGSINVAAPGQDAATGLVYRVWGNYSFVTAGDLRTTGKVRFDAHGYQSQVDYLGWLEPPAADIDSVWNNPYFDLDIFGSARILG